LYKCRTGRFRPKVDPKSSQAVLVLTVNVQSQEPGNRAAFASARRRLSEMLGAGASLERLVTEIVELVEQQCSGMLCSILFIEADGKHFRIGAAPNLPPAYNALFQGVLIGEGVGSCGTAAFRKERVIVSDIENDPLWANYKEFALPHGLRACWSSPIFSGNHLLGTFACYYKEPRTPSSDELRTIEAATKLASEVIHQFQSRVPVRHAATKTVLVVEDSDQFRELVCEFLKHDGHDVLEAANSEEALATWNQHSDRIDLVLTDIEMPGMSGLELASELQRKRSDIKVLFMSGTMYAPADGALMYLAKPFTRAELQHKIGLVFQ
jgi:CheY-like chemotaxis protein